MTPHTNPAALAVLRAQLGLTIKELAGLAGVSERRVHAWLAGTGRPSPTAAAKLSAAHHDYTAHLQDQLTTALRSRSRPVVLSVGSDQDVAMVAVLAAVLELRGVAHTIVEAPGAGDGPSGRG